MKTSKKHYRSRIYDQYTRVRDYPLASDTLAGLRLRAPYLNRLICDHFPVDRSARVLDLGCGYGALLYFGRQAGYRNIGGVDASQEQVEVAQRLGIEGVKQGDLLETLQGVPEESQNCIVTFDVIEHFTKLELPGIVDHVHRALSSGGRWIIHTPNGESPFSGHMRYGDFTHELAFTRESISQLLRTSGFSEVRCFEDAPIVHGVKSATRWILWKVIRATLRAYIAAETGDTGRDCIFSQNFLTVATKE